MTSWFELDISSIQNQLTKSVEEASRMIGEVNNLEILNLDAMAEREEQLKEEEYCLEYDEEDEEKDVAKSDYVSIPLQKEINHSFNENEKVIVNKKLNIKKLSFDDSNDFDWTNNVENSVGEACEMIKIESSDNISKLNLSDIIIDSETCTILPSLALVESYEKSDATETGESSSNYKSSVVTNLNSKHHNIETLVNKNLDDREIDASNPQINSQNRRKRKNKKSKLKEQKTKNLDFWGLSDLTSDNTVYNGDIFSESTSVGSGHNVSINSDSLKLNLTDNSVTNLVQNLPQNIATLVNLTSSFNTTSNSFYNYSFFDKIDEEIDLENDPILLQIERNKNSVNEKFNDTAANSNLSHIITDTFNHWSSYASGNNHFNEDTKHSIEINSAESHSQSKSQAELSASFCKKTKDILNNCANFVKKFYRKYALLLWDSISSAYGLSGLTAFLLICTYYKLQRQRSDIGGLN